MRAGRTPERYEWVCREGDCTFRWDGEDYDRSPPHPFCPDCSHPFLKKRLKASEWNWGVS